MLEEDLLVSSLLAGLCNSIRLPWLLLCLVGRLNVERQHGPTQRLLDPVGGNVVINVDLHLHHVNVEFMLVEQIVQDTTVLFLLHVGQLHRLVFAHERQQSTALRLLLLLLLHTAIAAVLLG